MEPDKNLFSNPVGQKTSQWQDTPFVAFYSVKLMREERAYHSEIN